MSTENREVFASVRDAFEKISKEYESDGIIAKPPFVSAIFREEYVTANVNSNTWFVAGNTIDIAEAGEMIAKIIAESGVNFVFEGK